MKNICHKIYIHPLFYLIAIISIITGQFKAFIMIMSILLFHELGHVLTALILKWNIRRIIVLPLGCMTEFNEKLNRPILEELLILVSGPIFQIILYIFYKTPYHYSLLFLNLLPIYPLDGSKFIFLFWNIIGSYYYSYVITFIISYLFIILLVINYHNFIILLFSFYLLWSSIEILVKKDECFYMFLYERYLNECLYYRKKIIQGFKYKKMKRSVKHYFLVDNKLISEHDVLFKLFNLTNNKKIV